jgi:hypothetical protein
LRDNVQNKLLWLLPPFGLLMILMGVYEAGGTELTCARSRLAPGISESADGSRPALVAECRFETRRWLGRKVTFDRTFLRVTTVDSIAVSRTESSKDSSGQTTRKTVEDWSIRLFDRDSEISRWPGTREQVERATATLRAWFARGGAEPIRMSFSSWAFTYAACGFGLVWTVLTAFGARVVNAGPNAGRRSTSLLYQRLQQQTRQRRQH